MKVQIVDSRHVSNPESRAVLQALVSRSAKPISEHIKIVNENKTNDFISVNCIGYGHDAVLENADSIIVNVSGVSMLAAKVIEDQNLFKGTEASTRYINVTQLPYVTNGGTQFEKNLVEKQLDFFDSFYPLVLEELTLRFPNTDNNPTHLKALQAKAFDSSRCYLPAGASTIVNWSTDVRNLKDHLHRMMGHPLAEIRNLAVMIGLEAQKAYPASFKNFPNQEIVDYISAHDMEYHYFEEDVSEYGPQDIWDNEKYAYQQIGIAYTSREIDYIEHTYKALEHRPKGCPAPRMYATNFNIFGAMDFGSFRDIQRQRNGKCKMAILRAKTFEEWYLNQLSSDLRKIAQEHVNTVQKSIQKFIAEGNLEVEAQYLVPFGFRVPYLLEYSLEQMIYVAELRSSKHVHATCRVVAQAMDDFMTEKLPIVKLHTDKSDAPFNIRRGEHDINLPGL